MKKPLLPVFLLLFLLQFKAGAQQFTSSGARTIAPYGSEVYDTILIAGQTHILNSAYGLDSITMNISYANDPDLLISLVAPDGTVLQLANYPGGGGPDFTGTCFDMHAATFINYGQVPYTGHFIPEGNIGMVNNGQTINGAWVLHVVNTINNTDDSGAILNWALHFDSTPATPSNFTSSNLPIVVVDTRDTVIPFVNDTKVFGTMKVIAGGAGQTNHITDSANAYNGHMRINVRGNSSSYYPTKSYAVETQDSAGNNNNVSLLGMPSDNDWILYAPWNDKSLIRDILTYQLSNEMGEYASRTRLCELVVNGDYRGVYVLMENIKQGSNRVPVHKMAVTDTAGEALTGGYIFSVDLGTQENYDFWFSNYLSCDDDANQVRFAYKYPKKSDLVQQQRDYLKAYIDSFETALKTLDLYDTVHGYRKYIDVPSFIDQSLLQELGHNADGYRASSYINKTRGGKLKGGPIWDFNEAFGNADYYDAWAYNTFMWDNPCPGGTDETSPFWWQKFLTDTNYVNELKCRYTTLRQTTFDTVHIDHIIDSLVTILQAPQQRHYQRWPILGVSLWPNYYVGATWNDELGYMKSWIHNRLQWMDSSLVNPACLPVVDTTTPTPTGIANMSTGSDTKIFPNPADNAVNIVSAYTIQKVALYNVMGQAVYESKVNTKQCTLQLKQLGLANGIYKIVLYTDGGMIHRKIVFTE